VNRERPKSDHHHRMPLFSTLFMMTELICSGMAWGPDGHTIVAHIADHYLSPEVDAVLRTDLYNVSLDNVSDWCDDYDHSPEGSWSEPLHFINYPGKACKFDWATDCKKDWCNAGAIVNYTRQIFDSSISKADRFFALKFVIHMVGDIHQPLHVSSGDDWGGNRIKIPGPHFSTSESHGSHYDTNLHSVWDGAIVIQDIYDIEDNLELTGKPFPVHYHKWQLLSDVLEKRIDGEWASNKTAWQTAMVGSRDETTLRAGLSIVASESAARGCEYAYNYANRSAVQNGDVLDRAYYLRAKPIVEEQLAKGGVRLAQLLKEALTQSRARVSEIVV
jgi:hypothetical protein